jgi:tol-pal system protein YbgF
VSTADLGGAACAAVARGRAARDAARRPTARAILGGALLSVSLLPACASTSLQDAELSLIRREVRALRAEIVEARARIEGLESKVDLLAASRLEPRGPAPVAAAPSRASDPSPGEPGDRPRGAARAEPARTAAATTTTGRLPALPVVKLEPAAPRGKNDGSPATAQAARAQAEPPRDLDLGAQDDGSPPVLIKVGPDAGGGDGEKLPVDRDVLEKVDPVLSATKPPRAEKPDRAAEAKAAEAKAKEPKESRATDDYRAALDTLREKKQPKEARRLFEVFRVKYPRSDLADNAAYWLGETYFAEGQWAAAIDAFAKLLADHPGSDKIPDALLRTGGAWLKLDKRREAQDVLARLARDYPGSEARGEADKLLSTLEPGGR